MGIPARVSARISAQLKKYQKVLGAAKQRDIGESDTVTIITDFLCDALGYDKYKEVSSEHAIRGTYVDRIVTVDNKKRFLIEAKAIGVELKDSHVKQAIDYAANEGVSWVVLSNGAVWRLYNLRFAKPIDKTLVFEINILSCDSKDEDTIGCFGSLSSEGYSKDSLTELLNEKQTSSKYTVAAVLRTEKIVESIRKEVRRLSGIRLDSEYLSSLLENEIVKRELIDSEEATAAAAYVKKLQKTAEKEKADATITVAAVAADAPSAG
ncbi:type I restriction enzyme HsdR N-terminal domain-containing protein [Bradyrhizobium septentrionale]|uniref:Type I restriction enzyme HsdR N-terminal domain-containing protein n=1 Tax=Bradyrhizobium septentrionale TaxID=1404411 RepID=A0A974A340_9BRAD|nr:type I restriction enzyme HsdR N-terminal domain-containing protein [Bradyrhizobium septentrionale]UGY15556.1 type I restriction enzyme HsdR N-terminal domain-containing protein [Bradyrhizobium septentrionale]UGY24139.1 type I restriction enzyme HsdR N-terminal domain-containing protein [Bradyrhizobium septentrionale]